MDKLVIGVVDADMEAVLPGAGFKKDQIARQQIVFIDFGADLRLLAGFARSLSEKRSRKVIITKPEQSTPPRLMPP